MLQPIQLVVWKTFWFAVIQQFATNVGEFFSHTQTGQGLVTPAEGSISDVSQTSNLLYLVQTVSPQHPAKVMPSPHVGLLLNLQRWQYKSALPKDNCCCSSLTHCSNSFKCSPHTIAVPTMCDSGLSLNSSSIIVSKTSTPLLTLQVPLGDDLRPCPCAKPPPLVRPGGWFSNRLAKVE